MKDQEDEIRIGPWATAVARVSKVLFRVEAGSSGGSAFAISVGSSGGSEPYGLLLATAYHVIDGFSQDDDEITITSADGNLVFTNREHEFSLFRLGPNKYDTGLIMVQTSEPFFIQDELLPLLPHDFVPAQGGSIGWMGYPSIAWPNPCFFKGVVSGSTEDSDAYYIDGVGIHGVSGGPAFNKEAMIFGIVSRYIPNQLDEQTTLPGLMLMVPTTLIEFWMGSVLGAERFTAA